MLRVSSRINVLSCKKAISPWKSQQFNQSTKSGSSLSSAGKGLAAAAGLTTILSGGVIGYSAWSNDNRKLIEDSIPGSNYVLESILGPLEVPKPKRAEILKPDAGLLQKKLEREKAKEKETQPKSALPAAGNPIITPPPSPPIEKPKKKEEIVQQKSAPPVPPVAPIPPVVKDEKQVASSEEIEKRLASSEKLESAENVTLTVQLMVIVKDAQKLVTDALTAAEQAAKVVRVHAEKAYAAIDSGEGHESLYATAAEMAKAKKELIKTAETKMSSAREKIQLLQDKIAGGRESKLTKDNTSLSVAEETVSELSYAITKISSTLAEALRDTTAISEFRHLVEASRTQFEAEVRSLLPDVKIGEKSDKLTTEELNLLLVHAHRKVLALQKALAKQQTVDKERYKDSVLRQREMEAKLLDGKLHSELERQRRDLGLEHRHRLQQVRDDMESEMRTQLKRQAAAHSDHLADMLNLQETELNRNWGTKLQDEVQRESDQYYKSLSELQGNLSGLKSALKSRADADKAARSAHELWLACESLKTSLRLGKENSRSWEDQLLPLQKSVQTIKEAAGNQDIFVKAVVSALPQESLSRGVYTEEALRERFLKVDRVCRRVVLVGENGGSLLRYLVSYIQSFFLVGAFDRIPGNELRDEEIDVEKLDTHDILARTRYCIAKDDLLQAVKYLNLLRGEPRNVASDWLREARLTLEARQAADALMAHAAATGARAL